MLYCQSCGTPIQSDAQFCEGCGRTLNRVAPGDHTLAFSCGPCNKVLHVSLNSPLALTIRFNHLTGAIDVA